MSLEGLFSNFIVSSFTVELFNASEKSQIGGPHKDLRYSVDFCDQLNPSPFAAQYN